MNNALLYLGGILISVLAILFAVPRFVDWNSYRGIFEEEATRILGREVRVGGAVNVRLLPAPYVSFERLRIADAGDEGGNSIIRVESFTMWLSVPPLLRGVLEAHKVELRRPVVNLATNAEGNGNWRTLALTPGSLSFAPKDVALQSVQIHDGAVVISAQERGELARFEDINGELNAEALEGPFKFRGQVSWNGAPRHVKLATAKLDANGELRFKAAVDVAGSGNSYMLDGRLRDLKDKPTLDGDLTAKLVLTPGDRTSTASDAFALDAPAATPTPSSPPTGVGDTAAPEAGAAPAPNAEPAAVPSAAPGSAKGFELKTKVKGTTLGAELQDIAVSLEAGTTPQLITGQAKIGWADKARLDVTLSSQWLDLDQLAHTTSKKMPLEAARSYFEVLAAALPAEADTNAQLDFDQITLGGEPISNVHLAASRSGGPLELKGVRADLPGGVRLELDGILTPAANVPRLDGSIFLSGNSLLRFLAWGIGSADVARDRNDGAFSLDGRFALGDGTLALSDAAFSFAGTPLKGGLKLDLGERKKVVMAVEGPRIDVAQIGPGLIGLNSLRGMLLGTGAPAAEGDRASSSPGTLFDPTRADLSLDLKVAELVDGSRILNDVDASIRIERGMLAIPHFKFATPEGLYVEAQGEAKDVPSRPLGSIRGLISAPNAEAARAFVALLDADTPQLDRIARLAPMRLAATLKLSSDGAKAGGNTLALDGTMGGGRLVASVRIDGEAGAWRSSPLDVQATLDSPDLAGLVTALFDARAQAPPGEPAKPGRMVIKATGVPEQGLLALADATADGLNLRYRGQVRLPASGETGLDGDLRIASPDVRLPLALAGLTPQAESATPISGSVHVRRAGPVVTLSGEGLALGASTLSGDVTLTSKSEGGQTIDAKLRTNAASFATLLSPILGQADAAESLVSSPSVAAAPDRSGRSPTADPQAAPPAPVIWPEKAFDLSLLDRLDGIIDVQAESLVLEPGLSIGNAHLIAQLSSAGVKVSRLEGDAVGGRLTSELDIAKAPAGVSLSGTARIDISSKPRAADASGPPPPGDAAAFHASFTSRALSPAALLSAAVGKGELTIGDATLNGNSPAAVSAVVRAALTGQGPSSGNALAEAIRGALKEGEVKLGKIAVPVEIGDGALKLKKVQIEMSEGRSTFVTAVELATMQIDSEWQIEPKLDKATTASAARAFLPPVTVVYTGKLNALADLVPHVSAGALERELIVRKMELDVGELERLRKLDQERAREDAERRKALEDDQATPVPPPPVPANAPPNKTSGEPGTTPPAPEASSPDAGGQQGTTAQGAWDTFDDTGVAPGAAAAQSAVPGPSQEVTPSPAAQRPRRKPRAVQEDWRPFQTPY